MNKNMTSDYDLELSKIDELYFLVKSSDYGILHEINDYFSFFVEGYKYMQKYRIGIWDGRARLFRLSDCKLYSGLIPDLLEFANKRNYSIKINDPLIYDIKDQVDVFLKTVPDILTFPPRDYQLSMCEKALKLNKCIVSSPVGSGKSGLAYLYSRFISDKLNGNVLIIVPTVSLVSQMIGDFKAYCKDYNIEQDCYGIQAGISKNLNNEKYVVSTWHSLIKQPKSWFNYFDAIIIDETHLAEGTSITNIINKCNHVKYKLGMSGSIKDSKTHQLTLKGIIGPIIQSTTTKQLMDRGILSNLEIHNIVLNYPQEAKDLLVTNDSYQKELKFVLFYEQRNNLICNIAKQETGNTLILFTYIEHGKLLLDKLKDSGKKLYFIDGSIESSERELIRENIESETGVIIIASYGTTSTGINYKNLHTIIFSSPYKSHVKVVQSIGRVLRLHSSKKTAKLIDICDNLSVKNSSINFLLRHSIERLKLYKKEQFDVKQININL